ncbi:MAG: 2Fe-2S iron-sulfur cluster binding domain-containing protein [Chloroflexi bacterium]|nr:MAG: 2Fe-2S iron-sulfur cluster binding domain-containing protein [Chloroflexota bacterium]TMD50405.1 MAG: 2Fe-2S iron-sulfur cluster binding domain-containing protein [Chloroflexota bacterium]
MARRFLPELAAAAPDRLRRDRGVAGRRRVPLPRHQCDQESLVTRSFQVTFTRSGKTLAVDETEGVLGAGLKAGLALAYDCRKGRCKTCMVKVDGIIDQSEAWLISNEELADGYALICVGKPRSNLRVHA